MYIYIYICIIYIYICNIYIYIYIYVYIYIYIYIYIYDILLGGAPTPLVAEDLPGEVAAPNKVQHTNVYYI